MPHCYILPRWPFCTSCISKSFKNVAVHLYQKLTHRNGMQKPLGRYIRGSLTVLKDRGLSSYYFTVQDKRANGVLIAFISSNENVIVLKKANCVFLWRFLSVETVRDKVGQFLPISYAWSSPAGFPRPVIHLLKTAILLKSKPFYYYFPLPSPYRKSVNEVMRKEEREWIVKFLNNWID